ncbi:MAG: MipA/OmpV family protein [Cetobacterium sp.]|uniref:MipA/OmpV family protein n=1 Tax=unclassified Cetobacterium TaxID=2630983 RepID=UPI00163BC2FF|nr:MipA/OmpV family protein [Cetobacterium sp. 2A]MBC2855724.1 MipA/OmpV family protein [Cetobacterium sp. 2A]
MKKTLMTIGIICMFANNIFASEELLNNGGFTEVVNDSETMFGVGIGVGVSNSLYKGVDDKGYPIPLLDIDYGNFYVKGLDIGYDLFQNDVLAFSIFMNPLTGFKVKGSDLETGYKDIDDRELQAMFGVHMGIDTKFENIKATISVSGGEHGSRGQLALFKPYSPTDNFILIPSAHINYYSADYTDYYFGVDSKETFKYRPSNVKLRNSYSPDAGYSLGLNLTGEYRLRDDIALMAFLGIEKFSDEISDSPLVENDVIYLMGVGAKYYF